MTATYGDEVYDLAEGFVDDMDIGEVTDESAEKVERKRLSKALATHIQQAIEDFTSSPEIFAPKAA